MSRRRVADLIFVGTLAIVGAVLVLQLTQVLTSGPPQVLQTVTCPNPPCAMNQP